ncbi:MAG: carboxypeptidase regulatory-like domain-containing protein [Terriglobales bacterium]
MWMGRLGRTALLALGLGTMLAAPLMAQTANTGTVIGVITDPSGAVVPHAPITLTDQATQQVRATLTNGSGRYSFVGVVPGTYTVTVKAPGFQAAQQSNLAVEVGRSYTISLKLKVGETSQTVEVNETATAELQTMDSTVGSTVGGDTLLQLPTQTRSATSLLLYQPASMPQQGPNQSSRQGGQVAGASSDQNTITLDGGNITNTTAANSDYFTGFTGAPEGSIPTPVESLQEFKVSTNNPNASFSGASGSQVMLVTKRGTDAYHGSAYWYLQNDVLDANSWDLNRLNQTRQVSKDNRVGGSLGGYIPGLPDKAKTYFYANWEGRWNSNNQEVSRLVPTDTLRQGILQFADASGTVQQYKLATAATCGPAGTGACDPRGLGLNPVIASLWSQYMPEGNDSSLGDGLNTTGFTSAANFPINDQFVVMRLDHSFGPNWQLMGSYRYFSEAAASTRQIDIGGFIAGDKLGTPVSVSNIPREPRYFVLGLTGQMTPNLTQQIHFDYLRDWWSWSTLGAPIQLPGQADAALEIGGETSNAPIPMNIDTGDSRMRTWLDHNYALSDDLSWLRGNHLLQFGGSFSHSNVHFNRNDGQTGSSTFPVYQVTSNAGINVPALYRPPACSSTVRSNCLPSSQNSNWDDFYTEALGMVDVGTVLGTRNGSFQPNPIGTYLFDNDTYSDTSLYANDSWHLRPSLTLNYGLNWSVEMPPTEANGTQALMVDAATGNVISPTAYLAARQSAAQSGQIYNPVLGFEPIGKTGLKYPWKTDYNNFAPRVAVAWNPNLGDGWLGSLFGHNRTVLRGGYARLYERLVGEQKVINGLQGLGFGQTLTCIGPTSTGSCAGQQGADPSSAFRIGTDGKSVPIPALSSAPAPLIPGTVTGSNSSFAPTTYQMDPDYAPGPNNEFDLTLQRSLNNFMVLELGYIGRTASRLYMPVQLNQVPYMMPLGGQTFAAAWAALSNEKLGGGAITPQPWFETALAGSSYCTGQPSCTAGMMAKLGSDVANQKVTTLWNAIQPSFAMGNVTASTSQVQSLFFWSNGAHSNYNAGFAALHVRNYNGLTLDTNLTWSHALGDKAENQDDDTTTSNSFDPNYDYGTLRFDRKLVLNILGSYNLPFGRGDDSLAHRLVRNWTISPIFSWFGGQPLHVATGSSQEWGQTSALGADAILTAPDTFGNAVHAASGTSGTVATTGNPAKGGTGLNLFADPAAVYGAFRPAILGVDNTSTGGMIRGMGHWNMDFALARKLQVSERLSATVNAQVFNAFNHVQFNDPSVSLQSPQSFGVIRSQLNAPRVVELGLHLDF